MIGITFDPTAIPESDQKQWWRDWSERAETATEKVVDRFEEWLESGDESPFDPKFDTAIWKDLKDWLLTNVFHQKCAYCEREISGYYGDAEHFRPKGAVKRKNPTGGFDQITVQLIDPKRGRFVTKSHPGYFWLAYDWRNLIPSCVFCNSGQGKNERFDAKEYVVMAKCKRNDVNALSPSLRPRQSKKWPGYYYLTPAQLDARESPFLLNPLNATADRNPREHLRFGVRGTVAAVDGSLFGTTSIETFQLKNERLRVARQGAQETFRSRYYDAMRHFDPLNPQQSEARQILNEYSRGQWPFSAAAIDYYKILHKTENALDASV